MPSSKRSNGFGVALAWRALGEVPWLIRVVAAEPFGLKSLTPAAGGTLAVIVMLLVRIAPLWLAQHLLFPCMLILAAIPPPYWIRAEQSSKRPIG